MAKIPGRLIVDLFPDGTVRIVFLSRIYVGDEIPLTVKDLDEAEVIFKMCGLTPGEAAALRGVVNFTKLASLGVSIDEEVAVKCRYKRP